ncbi:uncharacterized protein [Amphiura filiformis]|uniref:uncharacterized protein n=1 Tax=Amphiura filiformis TaxID=82378 RepID=UPI003B20C54F
MSEQKRKNLTNKFTYIFAVTGIGGVIVWNGIRRHLFYQGIYKHITTALIAGYAGTKYGEWGDRETRKRDYILEEYMQRHPEDFQKPPVTLMGEQFMRWRPCR